MDYECELWNLYLSVYIDYIFVYSVHLKLFLNNKKEFSYIHHFLVFVILPILFGKA
jgi:hypothetical protein